MKVSSTLQLRSAILRKVVHLSALVLAAAMLLPGVGRAEGLELVMVEQRGCAYCLAWHADVGPEYPITPEGRTAPLRVVDLRALPDDLSLARRPVFTPTFILMRDGQEITRLEGYPGEDFFWPLLGRMLDQADPGWSPAGVGG
jgi:hypothetical protein